MRVSYSESGRVWSGDGMKKVRGAEVKLVCLRTIEMRGEHCRGVLGSECQEVG